MHRATRTALAVVLVSALVPGVARAQVADADRATARALARDGYDAHRRGDYAMAADRFARADRLVHAPTLLLGVARANVGLGRLVEAHEVYYRILREGVDFEAPPAFARAVEDARREVAALEPRLAWVTILVRGPASPAVGLDGAPVPPPALGVRRPCDPGQHTVNATASGFASVKQTFSVDEGGEKTIAVAMQRLPGPADPVVQPDPDPAPVEGAAGHTSSAWTAAGIASLGVGAAGWVVGGLAGALALAKHASLDGECPDGRCPPAQSGEVDTYHTLTTVSTVGLIVGGLGTVTGVTILIAAPRSPTPVVAYAGPLGVGVRGSF